mmetsp:Transcript_16982/g.37103  ORF Transcript_16982/g.37103 Transcript_16982/m.37103 type:complete len:220 (+) Transcript_16982:75-734(+)|eukprot:CAMPEP_0168734364 /NCGR_PEP_ID=MMETSP0724-20121128/8774_1 /TAXON_ID=265536 /ORGANISM="Amphiprora sp., Strain CCMP467" /LENGTH=219 /DNA_ID=CAMNT_0008781463 /DNA_START=86 /DNA_END=745 /DNA_ORIENTATION=+
MKARTLNPMKLIVNRKTTRSGKAKVVFDDQDATSSASFSIDGSLHSRKLAQSADLFQVCFDEGQNVEHECSHDLSVEEIAQELWYTPDENKEMKEANSFSAKVARASESYVTSLEAVYQACQQGNMASAPLVANLEENVRLQPARTGLEQKVVKSMTQDRQARRQELVRLVYNLQHQLPAGTSSEQVALRLGQECAAVSKPAQLLAVQIAQASAATTSC